MANELLYNETCNDTPTNSQAQWYRWPDPRNNMPANWQAREYSKQIPRTPETQLKVLKTMKHNFVNLLVAFC